MTLEVHSDTEKESVEASFLFNLNVNSKHFFLIMDTVIIMVHLNDFRSAFDKPGLLQKVTTVSLNCENRIYCALWHASAFMV